MLITLSYEVCQFVKRRDLNPRPKAYELQKLKTSSYVLNSLASFLFIFIDCEIPSATKGIDGELISALPQTVIR